MGDSEQMSGKLRCFASHLMIIIRHEVIGSLARVRKVLAILGVVVNKRHSHDYIAPGVYLS